MWSRALTFLVGAVFYSQAFAADNYIAELMVESNVTLEAKTILSVLNSGLDLQVQDIQVNIFQSEVVAECELVGDKSNCSCSAGYIWSNTVCYTAKCCKDSPCDKIVAHFTPLCIAKVKVHINGSVTLNSGITWDDSKAAKLINAFGNLNGFEGLDVTRQRDSDNIADFVTSVSVRFETTRLQDTLKALEKTLGASILADTLGMVTMESPETAVSYHSHPTLKCTFEEATGSAGWNISRRNERFELDNGSVVNLDYSCTTKEYKSCVAVTLRNVTGNWEGTYECGFTSGSVRHTAKKELKVALLPDEITMKIKPLTVDCSEKSESDSMSVTVTAIILNSTETFNVTWSYSGEEKHQLDQLHPTLSGDHLYYSVKPSISCMSTTTGHYVKITFENWKTQQKTATVDIPVIYAGKKFCSTDVLNGVEWPNTPDGATVFHQTCEPGRVGYKARTCDNSKWQDVFSHCVSEELNKVLNAANNFKQGLGATQEVAMDIFLGLNNSGLVDMADISASISVLDTMASASESIALQDDVIPGFIGAASNMLNQSWNNVNTSIKKSMSSNYLQSVEGLVKHIKVKSMNAFNTQNLDLKICSKSNCNTSVFDISVNLNMTTGIFKTVGVKNLMDKLGNSKFHNSDPLSLLISATMENSTNSSLEITLDFPNEQLSGHRPRCVFWDTTNNDWSDTGCWLKTADDNHTLCQCNHLTSFSALMSKTALNLPYLEEITYVGLGVSIFSLVVFLIIEALVWSAVVKTNLSHFRHTALVNISLCLFLAECSFLASSFPEVLNDTWCLILTMCKHFFFLGMFCWTLCLSIMLVHQLIFVFSPLRKRVFMFFSSIVGYVFPTVIVGSSYVYYKYTNKLYHNKMTCWLIFDGLLIGSMHAFLLPVGTVIMTNLFSMVVVILTLVKSSAPDGNKADDKETVKSILKVVVFLTPVFGVTWILGFFQFYLDNTEDPLTAVVHYSFTILNSFQGFFILLTGCFAEQKVRGELFKLIIAKAPVKRKSESMRNLTATTTITHTK